MESAHWRCGSCEARFMSEDLAPRCPRCLKQSLVARAEPPAPVVPVVAEPPPPTPTPEQQLAGTRAAFRAVLLATTPAVLAAFLSSGAMGFRLEPLLALLFAVVTAPLAGWLAPGDAADRVFASAAALLAGVGTVIATTWYVHVRANAVNVELLLPVVSGALPGLGLFFVFRALDEHPLVRIVIAVGAVALAAGIVTGC